MKFHYLATSCFAALVSVFAASKAVAVTVDTPLGPYEGLSSSGADAFLGIQYATVGPRFSRSILNEETHQGVDATTYGPYCLQALPAGSEEVLGVYAAQEQDEECLYLNIWRPSVATSFSMLPTMVYIHGGGFNFGSAAEPTYSGANLAAEHGIVVVNLNYRLGLFGFLVSGENGYGGLNGIHDQINALTWVSKHIESFGGNPNDVTVFGESAGGFSVCMLCVSPLARGLFHRSISQSGDCALGIAQPNDAQGGAQITAMILKMTNSSSVAELSNATLFPAQELAPFSTADRIGWPTVDGWVLPNKPSHLYGNTKNIVPTDMILGSNSYRRWIGMAASKG